MQRQFVTLAPARRSGAEELTIVTYNILVSSFRRFRLHWKTQRRHWTRALQMWLAEHGSARNPCVVLRRRPTSTPRAASTATQRTSSWTGAAGGRAYWMRSAATMPTCSACRRCGICGASWFFNNCQIHRRSCLLRALQLMRLIRLQNSRLNLAAPPQVEKPVFEEQLLPSLPDHAGIFYGRRATLLQSCAYAVDHGDVCHVAQRERREKTLGVIPVVLECSGRSGRATLCRAPRRASRC